MKKAFYILFSLYFIALVTIPCGDADDCNEVNHTQTAQNDKHEHQDEACTPFCVCSCCATHYLSTTVTNEMVVASIEIQSYAQPTTSKVRGAVLPIWQPPKLA